ncbi:MAG TPA: GNAT family N-acetyltransferase [Chloroflexota bacterium]|nr:GNAT family N-acetyltransferase [Chloroflexota bacterium]
MPELHIRPIQADEAERAFEIQDYAFGGRLPEPGDFEALEWLKPGRDLLGGFEDGELVSKVEILEFAIWIAGARFPTGGLAGVVTVPERTGRGYAQKTLRQTIAWMRDELGLCLSTLYPTVPPLYNGLGWTVAETSLRWSGSPEAFRPSPRLPRDPGEQITRRAARVEDAELLEPIYRAFAQPRSGYVDRPEWMWKNLLRGRPKQPPRWLATWTGTDGKLAGYLLYSMEREQDPSLRVHDFIALRPEAYRGLLQYLSAHHLWPKIVLPLGREIPLASLVENHRRLSGEVPASRYFMLRVLDLPAAIQRRAVRGEAGAADLVIAVTDADAPWNAGNWLIGQRPGAAGPRWVCERTDHPPQAHLDIRTVADLFGGYLRPRQAQELGLLSATPDALPALEAIFHTTHPPTSLDHF